MKCVLISLPMLFQPAIVNIQLGQAYVLIFLLLTITVVGWQTHKDKPGASASVPDRHSPRPFRPNRPVEEAQSEVGGLSLRPWV